MIRILAYAKLNLSLDVLSRRADGYHEIESLVQRIDLADQITMRRSKGRLVVENDMDIPSEGDLAWLAARLLLDKKRSQMGLEVRVQKSIPAGAGLGGGSSDAAAVLWAANILTPPVISADRLTELSRELGSDVPLFLHGGLVRVTGRGEKVDRVLPCRQESFVVVIPPIHCDTALVYNQMKPKPSSGKGYVEQSELGHNDLYDAAVSLYPRLAYYKQAIAHANGSYGGMSGSGSAFYVAFDDRGDAVLARDDLEAELPEAKVFLSRGVSVGFEARGEE